MLKSLSTLEELEKKVLEELKPFFNPNNIAIVGVSTKPNSMGWTIFKNMLERKNSGILRAKVFGVNIRGGELFGEKLYRSILEIEEKIDLVIVVVPAKFVPSVLEEAGKKGVRAAIIISAGFAEIGNYELDRQLREIIKKYKIRLIGPNCIGVLDNYSGVDTLFLPTKKIVEGKEVESMPRPKRGYVAFISQSGALGGTVLDYIYGEGIGISKFVNYGNKIDVDEVDMLLYLKNDETVRVIMVYIEGIYGAERGRLFADVARYVSREKPIVLLKGGRTKAGSRAVVSHTASLAGDVRLYEHILRNSGIIYAKNIWEFTDITKALLYQPPAKGKRIVIVTNGGGPGVVVADYAEFLGLNVIPLPEDLVDKLRGYVEDGYIPKVATFSNPIDLSASADGKAYAIATKEALLHPEVDGVILLALHHPPPLTEKFVEEIVNEVKGILKPLVVVDVGSVEMAKWTRRKFEEYGIPAYDTPERGAIAMKGLAEYGEFLKKEGVFKKYLEKFFKSG